MSVEADRYRAAFLLSNVKPSGGCHRQTSQPQSLLCIMGDWGGYPNKNVQWGYHCALLTTLCLTPRTAFASLRTGHFSTTPKNFPFWDLHGRNTQWTSLVEWNQSFNICICTISWVVQIYCGGDLNSSTKQGIPSNHLELYKIANGKTATVRNEKENRAWNKVFSCIALAT